MWLPSCCYTWPSKSALIYSDLGFQRAERINGLCSLDDQCHARITSGLRHLHEWRSGHIAFFHAGYTANVLSPKFDFLSAVQNMLGQAEVQVSNFDMLYILEMVNSTAHRLQTVNAVMT